ncbi:sodium:proton antiporter [Malaciobacter molluscorum LMG 25693]|uniref:Sodium:proton antiporter n=1 Tax=Malaciobacter molluscorum LMG 25693 TaxID=870501 RepID=A0A2G1DGM0_9BACT|nr:Na+/H+ antiporter family protein [Malaciobacter molluscorum]AXX92478.1 YuiF family protein, putative amino acid transporter [Malaciobacter molluscorum LMG 25693]PHO17652.1 sodium:proton antiporter [Malaciobacter molluscorum LMG 25693]
MFNPVVVAVLLMIILSLFRINVVIALVFSAIIGGLVSGMSLIETINSFSNGLGGGATIALNYAMLGAFAVAISKSGITDLLAKKIISKMKNDATKKEIFWFKTVLLTLILLASVSSQNLIPVHIAFIPILIPPLLHVFAEYEIDRRLIACILTFGLTATYMLLPVGFGGIFLNNILLKNLVENGATVTANQLPYVMAIPVSGMFLGLLVAIFFSYRKPRKYCLEKIKEIEPENQEIKTSYIFTAIIAIVAALYLQLDTDSIIIGSLAGFIIFMIGGVIKIDETQDVFTKGVHMMAMIGFIMIAASGFAEVMKASHGIESLVSSITHIIGHNKSLAALFMLVVGLLVTMGIGSSFSTIPIIAVIYVPLAMQFGFSPLGVAVLVGTAAALGDAGSPASDSTLGPTSGLGVDGQHDHIWDSVVPTFIHYNIPLILFGWFAALYL